jgi:hypothetical protein
MNPRIAYAKIAKSFQTLYRQREPESRFTIAVACAMSGLLVINNWCLILLFVDHGSLSSRRRISPVEFVALCAGLFIVEIILVNRVFIRIEKDERFASRVVPAPPRISMWYLGISIVLLVGSTILKLGSS